MLKLVDTSQKCIILGIFILDKVTRLRALLDPPPPQDGVSEFTGRYPLFVALSCISFIYLVILFIDCNTCNTLAIRPLQKTDHMSVTNVSFRPFLALTRSAHFSTTTSTFLVSGVLDNVYVYGHMTQEGLRWVHFCHCNIYMPRVVCHIGFNSFFFFESNFKSIGAKPLGLLTISVLHG